MPIVNLHLSSWGVPFIDSRSFSEVPRVGELVQIKGIDGAIAYRVKEILHKSPEEGGEIAISLIEPNATQQIPQPQQQNHQIQQAIGPAYSPSEEAKKIFEQAKSYNNFIMAAGYAGIFALWSLVRDHLSAPRSGTIALLVGFSLFIFVLNELIGMLSRGLITTNQPSETSIALKIGHAIEDFNTKIWIWYFTLSTAPAVVAALLLFYGIYNEMLFKTVISPQP